jgi:hypothetical protein
VRRIGDSARLVSAGLGSSAKSSAAQCSCSRQVAPVECARSALLGGRLRDVGLPTASPEGEPLTTSHEEVASDLVGLSPTGRLLPSGFEISALAQWASR